MPATLRKLQDIWTAFDDQRIAAKLKSREWKQSYKGVTAALAHVGLKMMTTEEEFAKLPAPNQSSGSSKHYSRRKVCVSRDGIGSQPTEITGLLSGTSGLLTDAERAAINAAKGVARCNLVL